MKFHELIHKTIISFLVFSLLACSKDEGTNAAVPASFQTAEVQDVNTNTPNFESQGNLSQVVRDSRERKSIKAFGCRNRDVIDPSMQVGDKKIIRRLIYRPGEHLEEIRSNQIMSIRARTKIEMKEEILSMVISEAGGEIIENRFSTHYVCERKAGRQFTSTCTKKDQARSDEMFLNSISPRGRQHQQNTKNIPDCEIESVVSSSVTRNTEIGFFTLGDQARVRAVKETTTYDGRVVCQQGNVKTDLGAGSAMTIEIRAIDIVPGPDNMDSCGGTLVTSGTTILLQGRVIQSGRWEVLSAPLRDDVR